MADSSNPTKSGFDVGFEGHQRRQACLGLALTPAQRLTWLESKLREMRGLLGTARPSAASENSLDGAVLVLPPDETLK